jgi:hypothetical protein
MIYNIRRVTIARTTDDHVKRYGYNTDMFCTDLKAERTRLKSSLQADIVHLVYTELPDYNPETLSK